MVCGFDFINETIIPVEIRNISSILNDLNDFLCSEYNIENIMIDSLSELLKHFKEVKIKKGVHTYKKISILTTTQRNIILGDCEIFSKENLISPNTTLLIANRSSLIFGEIKFLNNPETVQRLKKIHLSEDVIVRYQVNDFSIDSVATIYNLKKNIEGLSLFLSSFIYELSKKKLDVMSFSSSDPHSPIHAILRSSGLLKEQINIEVFKSKYVPFLVLIPIDNLVLNIP